MDPTSANSTLIHRFCLSSMIERDKSSSSEILVHCGEVTVIKLREKGGSGSISTVGKAIYSKCRFASREKVLFIMFVFR